MISAMGAMRADLNDFEWFNAWWDQTRPAANRRAGDLTFLARSRSAGHALAAATRAALVARDVAEIEKVRDRLFAMAEAGNFTRVKPLQSARPAKNTGPVVLGAVVGMLVLAISSAAAAFMKFAR